MKALDSFEQWDSVTGRECLSWGCCLKHDYREAGRAGSGGQEFGDSPGGPAGWEPLF